MSGAVGPEVAVWARAAVTERLELARKATQVPWEPEGDDPTDDEVWIDVDGEEWRHVVCRGPQSHENMLHIAANDPQDTIARCEAELAILDEHQPNGNPADEWYGSDVRCTACGGYNLVAGLGAQGYRSSWPCRTVRFVAAGYRHCPGYQQAWHPDRSQRPSPPSPP